MLTRTRTWALAHRGRFADALRHLDDALRFNPSHAGGSREPRCRRPIAAMKQGVTVPIATLRYEPSRLIDDRHDINRRR
jgi:hypothetical protein